VTTRRLRFAALAITLTLLADIATIGVRAVSGPETIDLTAVFSKTIGLFPSSQVRVLGVSVGRVISVTPQGEDVKVLMRVEKTRKIPADARATIVPISLISDRYVQLFPPYEAGPVMRTGAVIGTDRTFIPAELDDLLAQLKKLLDAVRSDTPEGTAAIGQFINNLAAALKGTGADLSATLGGAGGLSGTVLARSADVDGIVVHLSALLSALSQRRADLIEVNAKLADALGAIAAEHTSLDGALANIDLMTGQLSSLVHDHKAALETDLKTLAKTTQVVIRHQDSLIRTLDWLPVLDDGVEGEHEGGAVDVTASPVHIDVRDAHFTSCPPDVPVALCVLLDLNGTPLPVASSTPAGGKESRPPSSSQPAHSTAPSIFDLLRALPSPSEPGLPALPTPTSTPGGTVGGLIDRLGGTLDIAIRWIW